jgi:hypothetical protein
VSDSHRSAAVLARSPQPQRRVYLMAELLATVMASFVLYVRHGRASSRPSTFLLNDFVGRRNEASFPFAADEGRGCPGQARARRLVRRSDTITERLEEAS